MKGQRRWWATVPLAGPYGGRNKTLPRYQGWWLVARRRDLLRTGAALPDPVREVTA